MTSREIILANIEHTGAPQPGLNFPESKNMISDFVFGGPGMPVGYEPKRWLDGDQEYYDDIWENLWVRMKDGCRAGEVCKPAIEDWSQLETFRVPEFDLKSCTKNYRQAFAAKPDKFRVAGMSGWIFAASRYLRKMEIYLMDLALYPEEVKRLHGMVAEVFKIQIAAAGKAGADAIMFAEDMGTQTGLLMSPAMWQEYFGVLYAELFGLARERGMKVIMHSCGKNDEIVEPLLRAGVNCFQFDQPTVYNPEWLRGMLKQYQAALWSPIDIQKILPTGNRAIIEQGVDDMFRHYSGHLIFNQYGDLPGIGVEEEWNRWAYDRIIDNIRKLGIRI